MFEELQLALSLKNLNDAFDIIKEFDSFHSFKNPGDFADYNRLLILKGRYFFEIGSYREAEKYFRRRHDGLSSIF